MVLPRGSGAEAFNGWANAAAVLQALGRNTEALAANESAQEIFSDSSFLHWQRGNLLLAVGQPSEAEPEYLKAVSLQPSDVTWGALSDFYRTRGRMAESIDAMQRAAAFSVRPYSLRQNLGYLYLRANAPEQALKSFAEAERSAPRNIGASDDGTFDFMLAQGRSVAWNQLGDWTKATSFQEKATAIKPDAPEPWQRLAKLYQHQGRTEDAFRANEHAAEAAQKAGH